MGKALGRLLVGVMLLCGARAVASELCPAEQPRPLSVTDPALCASLAPVVRKPGALPLNEYEAALGQWLRAWCHRDPASGWVRDKYIRPAGPFIATMANGGWTGTNFATHSPVMIWYSPEMHAWLKANRSGSETAAGAPEVPDGAIMIKEMYKGAPTACDGIDPLRLIPSSGAALMVRDRGASQDGWFWGWFGWDDTSTDWPPRPGNNETYMGFGQYCVNCHASASDNFTFSALSNIDKEPGRPLNFLVQDFFLRSSNQTAPRVPAGTPPPRDDHHTELTSGRGPQPAAAPPVDRKAFLTALGLPNLSIPTDKTVSRMPSATYDTVWAPANGPNPHGIFLTSDQCAGCHSAGSTGLSYDMTEPLPDGTLANVSPFGGWRFSPMGLAGRDPIFFAQLASEVEAFHPQQSSFIQDACLGCHGMMGQRQFGIDTPPPSGSPGGGAAASSECAPFSRAHVDAVPFPLNNPDAGFARYGALAREGVSCLACHRIALGAKDEAPVKDDPANRCVAQRQEALNPHTTGFARTMTGSFLLGKADTINGPFPDPKTMPMASVLAMKPAHNATVQSSELCGTCHTVHLPILRGAETLGYVYEQSTYAEWAFSAYRTGSSPDGPLPFGPGDRAQSCQGCHLPNVDDKGKPYRSKIASIQESRGFPAVEHGANPADIDLPVREGFAKHLLVGLNYFLVRMAGQFADVLGLPSTDPMLVDLAPDPSRVTRDAIVKQAQTQTADIAVEGMTVANNTLSATVRVTNKAGHKFPSGVGFRRAFIEFQALDANGKVVWASGRTNGAGVLVDQAGKPIPGEMWWRPDCSARIDPNARTHQPHYRTIGRQDQAQIFEELVTAPPASGPAQCGRDQSATGPLTTSFLSICGVAKDNRLQPHGILPIADRLTIAKALGAQAELAEDTTSIGVGDDPGYRNGGFSTVTYRVPLAGLPSRPVSVVATLHYQATPPYFLQDRFCTSQSVDTKRLAYIASGLDLRNGPAESWKLKLVSTGPVAVPR